MKAHEVIIFTDGAPDFPVINGLSIDGHDILTPEGSEVRVGSGSGVMTATITLFANVQVKARPPVSACR